MDALPQIGYFGAPDVPRPHYRSRTLWCLIAQRVHGILPAVPVQLLELDTWLQTTSKRQTEGTEANILPCRKIVQT